MRIEISSETRRGSARSRTDDGLRTERLLIDQIDSGVFAASSDKAFRVRQARDQSDFQLAEERKESDKNLLREQSARNAAVAALVDREESLTVFGHDMKSIIQAHGGRIWAKSRLGSGTTFFFTVPAAAGSRPRKAPGRALAS